MGQGRGWTMNGGVFGDMVQSKWPRDIVYKVGSDRWTVHVKDILP